MNSLLGFTVFTHISESRMKALEVAHKLALTQFPHLVQRSLTLGETQVEIWGHKGMDERVHTMPDGSLLVLAGSPHNKVAWKDAKDKLLSNDFELPWEGRVILLRISSDGRRWEMWNDWLGSIPVFHAEIESGRIASTLEPVTVAAAGYTPEDFYMPGLVSLLINGHFLSDWTLYKGMKVNPPDSVAEWDEGGFRAKPLWSVVPSQSRWEAGWDDLIDEMHELSRKAIADTLKTQSSWILPLSSGMDSRLIAGVAADVGVEAYTYAWGASNTTDVVHSRQIARTLGLPWKHIDLPKDFLVNYTPHWADWFGSAMHFHGMYQMAFLDEIQGEASSPIIPGFIGDVLAGDAIDELTKQHVSKSYQLECDWYSHWTTKKLKSAVKFPLAEPLEANAQNLTDQIDSLPGARYQKLQYLELWNRQRFFTSFQSTLSDYWRGVATPFMDRAYARFCLSLPRAALDKRRLLRDVYRSYYGRLSVIPGTYANEPMIMTGRYLLNRRIAKRLPKHLRRGPFAGYENIQLRMDIESLQAAGRDALWPIFDAGSQLSEWLDVSQLEQDYQTLMHSKKDIRPLRRLQSVQALALRLID